MKSRIASKITFPDNVKEVDFVDKSGIKYKLFLDQYVMRNIFLYGISEGNTVRHLKKILRPGMICVDAGANIGTYTLLFSKFVGKEGKVFAFEPLQINFGRLLNNLQLNNSENVVAVNAGLSNKATSSTIYFGSKNSGASIFRTDLPNSEEIELITLDEYLSNQAVTEIDILKIDVEGAEDLVLSGALNTINSSKRLVIVMECIQTIQNEGGGDVNNLFNFMISKGFKAYFPSKWPFSMRRAMAPPPNSYSDNLIFIKSER